MSTVSQEMSSTFKLPNEKWAKLVIKIDGIDTEQNIENQIREANNAMDQIYGTMKNRLETQIQDAVDDCMNAIPEVD